MATHIAFPAAPQSAFRPDPEVHRLRQEIQILDAKIESASSLIEKFDLEGTRRGMDDQYQVAFDAADPARLFCPEFLAQADADYFGFDNGM